MERETERDVWLAHDRRLGEQDTKIHDTNRSIDAIERELRGLVERINMGVSPTQNKILDKQGAIELAITSLEHKMELSLKDMQDNQEKQLAVVVVKQEEQGKSIDNLKRVLIYGVVAGLLAAGAKATIDHFFDSDKSQQTKQGRR